MRITPFHHFLLVLFLFTNSVAFAEVLHWPQLCNKAELLVKNKSQRSLSVWLQKFRKTLISETEFELKAKETVTLAVEKNEVDERFSLLHFSNSQNIEAQLNCSDASYPTSTVEDGVLTFKKSDLETNKLWLQNLFTDKNLVEISLLDKNANKLITYKLELSSLAALTYALPAFNWVQIQVSSSNKLSVFNLNSVSAELPVKTQPQPTQVDTQASYFLIGPRTGTGDSFTVQIKDSQLIARARDLIQNPQKEKMLFAKIQKDHQGINRNWSKNEKSLWSWSTSEVTNFADIGSTACNGLPQEVEDRIDYWVNDPGQICFWNYRVKRELSAQEVSAGLFQP